MLDATFKRECCIQLFIAFQQLIIFYKSKIYKKLANCDKVSVVQHWDVPFVLGRCNPAHVGFYLKSAILLNQTYKWFTFVRRVLACSIFFVYIINFSFNELL